jgi:hypothetical protein
MTCSAVPAYIARAAAWALDAAVPVTAVPIAGGEPRLPEFAAVVDDEWLLAPEEIATPPPAMAPTAAMLATIRMMFFFVIARSFLVCPTHDRAQAWAKCWKTLSVV